MSNTSNATDDDAAVAVDRSANTDKPTGTAADQYGGLDDLGLDPNDPIAAQVLQMVGDREKGSATYLAEHADDADADTDEPAEPAPDTERVEPAAPGALPDGVPPGIPPDAVPDEEPSDESSSVPAPEEDGTDTGPTVRVGDRDIPVAQIPALLSSHDLLTSINPTQAQAIWGFLHGQYMLVPAQDAGQGPVPPGVPLPPGGTGYPQYQPQPQPQQPYYQPSPQQPYQQSYQQPQPPYPQTSPQPVDYSQLADLDPNLAAAFQQQQQELAILRDQINQQAEQVYAAQQDSVQQIIASAQSSVAEKYHLSPIETAQLAQVTADMALVPYFRQQHADPVEAVKAAMDAAYGIDPRFRERELRRLGTTPPAEDAELQARKARASSTAGGSSTVSRTPTPTPPRQMNDRDRLNAMAQMIADDMGQQQ